MKKIIACLVCIVATSLAFAKDAAWNQHQGNFAELTAGTNVYYLGILSSEGKAGDGGVLGTGWSGALGYNFTPIFALEAGFMQNFADFNDGSHVNAPYATTRFSLPIGERFSFIGKLGLMFPVVPGEGGLLLPYTGIGGSYAVTEDVDLSLQYQGAVYGIAGAGLLGLGITYHFDW